MRDDAVLRRALPLGRGLGRKGKDRHLYRVQSEVNTQFHTDGYG